MTRGGRAFARQPPNREEDEGSSGDSDGPKPELDDRMKKTYWRFGAMIATSTVAMFVLMYFNTYEWDHVQWSETRFYMTFVMGSTMAVIMLLFMLRTQAELDARPIPDFEATNGRDEV